LQELLEQFLLRFLFSTELIIFSLEAEPLLGQDLVTLQLMEQQPPTLPEALQ
jgi:hypothetical protein